MLELTGVMFSVLYELHWDWPTVENPYVSLTAQQVSYQLNVTAILFEVNVYNI